MKSLEQSKKIVLTLDAGGTNFLFSAMRGGKHIVEPVNLPAVSDTVDGCVNVLVKGFNTVREQLKKKPDAISFAFPGPADYPRGIIGDLPNFKAFNGGTPLKNILEHRLNLPVYINNDGNLFALGVAQGGILPHINQDLRKAGNTMQYKTLLAVTLGTGFGIGITIDGKALLGDCGFGPEIFCTSTRYLPCNAEEGVSIRAIKREYARLAGMEEKDAPEPVDIYAIAMGELEGNTEAAKESFALMGRIMGDVFANIISILGGGIIVVGGGLSKAHKFIFPAMLKEMNTPHKPLSGSPCPRLVQKVYNLDDPFQYEDFLEGTEQKITVEETGEELFYDPISRVGVAKSRRGANEAISLGAYAFAVEKVQK